MDFFTYYWSILLVIPGVILGIWAQSRVSSTFRAFSKVMSRRGATSNEAVETILTTNGISGVSLVEDRGELTDHYNPKKRVIQLSRGVYGSSSIAAVAIAAHECGHVIQHHTGYGFLKFRTALVPVVNLCSTLFMPLVLLGLIFALPSLMNIGVWLFAATLLFQLVTLPVEFNASSRALKSIEANGLLVGDELPMAKKVLNAAAMTYVASLVMTLLSLLRLLLLTRSRN